MKRIISFILLFIMILPLFSCEKRDKYYSASIEGVFDSVATLTAYGKDKEDFNNVRNEVFRSLLVYHELFDIYNEYSGMNNLCTINKNPKKEIEVSKDLIEFLEYAKQAYYLTNGEMNIAFGSVLSIWHLFRENGTENPKKAVLPDMNDLTEANKHTDIEKIVIDKEKSTVMLADEKMSIDVGAIAKGYATEKCAEYLELIGANGYLLSVGGNVRAIGKKNESENFTIGIENPNEKGYIEKLSIDNMSVVTSGDYQRYFEVDGKRYHHIIDKDTLFPKNEFRLVSVVTENSALADALSTAIFNMTLEEGKDFVNNLDGVEAIWLLPDESKIYSNGFGAYIKK